MPNSIIWIGLVVVWIFVLLPMLVKQRPPVRVTTEAALAARVVHRGDDPRSEQRRTAGAVATRVREHPSDVTRSRPADEEPEDRMQDDDSRRREARAGSARADDHEDDAVERASTRRSYRDPSDGYVPDRSGRGGYDPEADALARAARYGFRRRAVLGGTVGVVIAIMLAVIVSPVFWWVAAAAAVGLAFYLAYLRRQVRIEEDIRRRRVARIRRLEGDADDDPAPRPSGRAGRRPAADDDADYDLDEPDEGDFEEPRYRAVEEVRRRPAPRRAPAGRPVAVDEDDPTFDELDDADEAALPRARGA